MCREDRSEFVREREKANYCEYFVLGEINISAGDPNGDPKEKARTELADLFEKKK